MTNVPANTSARLSIPLPAAPLHHQAGGVTPTCAANQATCDRVGINDTICAITSESGRCACDCAGGEASELGMLAPMQSVVCWTGRGRWSSSISSRTPDSSEDASEGQCQQAHRGTHATMESDGGHDRRRMDVASSAIIVTYDFIHTIISCFLIGRNSEKKLMFRGNPRALTVCLSMR